MEVCGCIGKAWIIGDSSSVKKKWEFLNSERQVNNMIYTITLNPALDYYMMVDKELIDDEVNRSEREVYKAGGKGLNVSKVLSLYGYQSKAVALVGGFTGDYIKEIFSKFSCIDFIPIQVMGTTRINVKIIGASKALCINGNGTTATEVSKKQVLDVLQNISKEDYVLVCGKLSAGLTADFIKEIADQVHAANAKLIIDMESLNEQMIRDCKPYLIKPNLYELGLILNTSEITLEHLKSSCDLLLNYGLKSILVSLGKDGAYYTNGKTAWKVSQPVIKAINKVGCGDAMLASFIGKLANGESIEECLKVATAAGCATASTIDDTTLTDIMRLYPMMQVEKV